MSKKKLLFYGDTPTCDTGFATVSKNILKYLHETGEYDISVLGINYFGEQHDLPYKIYPAGLNEQNDIYGKQKLINFLRDGDFDILFTIQDTFIMQYVGETIAKLRDGYIADEKGKKIKKNGKGFKWLYYYPIDADPKKEWIEGSVKFCDIAVPYTNFAKEQSEKFVERDYNVIYHGFDQSTFYEITEDEKEEFRKEFFKKNNLKDKFLIVNVNRNQERKGLAQTLIAFKMFNNVFPDSVLYTHCDVTGDRGGNLIDLARQIGLDRNWIYPNPDIYKNKIKIPASYINKIYNIADVNISTTYGEGFGLSLVEAMATKTLNIFPNNTAIKELLNDGRGRLVECGNTPNNLIFNGHVDNNLIRPVTDIEDMVNNLMWAYRNPEERKKIEEKAYQWVNKNMKWDQISEKFHKLLS